MRIEDKISLLEELIEADEGSIKCCDELSEVENWDSLNVLAFIAMADEKFNLILSPEMIREAKTVGCLLDLLDEKVHG